MTLPNTDPSWRERSSTRDPGKGEGSITGSVLIVDDEAGVAHLCKRILERSGMSVTAFTTPEEGLHFLDLHSVDLLLVDFRMPGIDGFQLMEQAHHKYPDLAVVIMTGYGTLETAIEALQRGADGLVLKPFTGKELVESIHHALEQSHQKQDILRLQALRPLFDVTERLFSETNPKRLQDLLLEAVCGYLQCAYAVLHENDSKNRESDGNHDEDRRVHRIRFRGREDTRPFRNEAHTALIRTVSRWVVENGTPLLIDAHALQKSQTASQELAVTAILPGEHAGNELILQDVMTKAGVGSILVAPLVYGVDHHQALLFAIRLNNDPSFRESDLEMFMILARQAGVALENARLHTELRAYIGQVEASQRALVQAEKMAIAGRLTASIAHEINNPLQSVHNCLHLAGRRELSDSKREEYRKLAQDELERLMQTVQRMLEFYRPSAVDRKPTDLNATIKKVLTLMAKQISDCHVRVSLHLDEKLPFVFVAEDQIQQVFLNLALNALEAMHEGGELWIESRMLKSNIKKLTGEGLLAEDSVVFYFCDTGPGIPPAKRKHLFEPFVSTKKDGTGLGLAVSYGIITAHGGNLELVDSESNGLQLANRSRSSLGACFCITLPIS